MGDRRAEDEQGYEGDVSDHAGDRLGGAPLKEPEVEIAPPPGPGTPPSEA